MGVCCRNGANCLEPCFSRFPNLFTGPPIAPYPPDMKTTSPLLLWLALASLSACAPAIRPHLDTAESRTPPSEPQTGPALRFMFNRTVENATDRPAAPTVHGTPSFSPGLEGTALHVDPDGPVATIAVERQHLSMGPSQDFAVQFWVRTDAPVDRRFVLLSQKTFPDNSLASQKNAGWVFYMSGGTWAWSMGSGNRRITYERDNGHRMPLNDGQWHQLAMTYSSEPSEVRLYYDGINWVTYHVSDSNGFDFSNENPLTVGVSQRPEPRPEPLPEIEAGARGLQTLVDAFDALGLSPLAPDELVHLVVDPRQLFAEKVDREAHQLGADSLAFRRRMDSVDWEPVAAAERALMANPYTVHQNLNFTETAPLKRVYRLQDGRVEIQPAGALLYAERERLDAPDFDMDEMALWERTLGREEIAASYADHFEPSQAPSLESVDSLTAACWNIWHGGKHWTLQEHGWDSRVAIAEMLREADTDVVMMQETYSSGDFIAAELGFYFATTVDWDYLNQGANISVLKDSPASVTLLEAGFTDAYRSLYPDAATHPAPTHRSGERIDQLYYRGAGLTNLSTQIVSERATGFPSDHYLILSTFGLDYATRRVVH